MHGGSFVLFDDDFSFSFMAHVLSVFEFRGLCNLLVSTFWGGP